MKDIKRMTNIALIAAVYFVLSMAFQFMSFGQIQVRVAELLIITAIIDKDGITGTTLGCLITNAIGVAMGFNSVGAIDVVFGTLLTLISSILAYQLRNHRISKFNLPVLSLMMPVVVNAIGLPIVFAFAFHQGFYLNVYLIEFLSIFIGQFISCVVLGIFLFPKIEKTLTKHTKVA